MSDPHHTPNPSTHHVAETAPMHDPVDAWHDHSRDEKPQHAHAEVQNSNLIMFVGVALTGVIGLSSLVVYGFYTYYNTHRMAEREHMPRAGAYSDLAESPSEEARSNKARDMLVLERGGSIKMPTEQENITRTVTLSPIALAMDEVAQSYSAPAPPANRPSK